MLHFARHSCEYAGLHADRTNHGSLPGRSIYLSQESQKRSFFPNVIPPLCRRRQSCIFISPISWARLCAHSPADRRPSCSQVCIHASMISSVWIVVCRLKLLPQFDRDPLPRAVMEFHLVLPSAFVRTSPLLLYRRSTPSMFLSRNQKHCQS